MIELPGLWSLSPLAALVGVLVLLFLSLSRGAYIPKSSHERELSLQRERADDWKETAKRLESVNAEIREQNTLLIKGNEVTAYFFRTMAPGLENTDPFKTGGGA